MTINHVNWREFEFPEWDYFLFKYRLKFSPNHFFLPFQNIVKKLL